jgi:cytochrome P450
LPSWWNDRLARSPTSANRHQREDAEKTCDEGVFEDPFEFDVTRSPNPHVGFGQGVHFCLGANLARLEMRVMFESLLERYEDFELTSPHEWVTNNRLFGLKRLPVRAIRK